MTQSDQTPVVAEPRRLRTLVTDNTLVNTCWRMSRKDLRMRNPALSPSRRNPRCSGEHEFARLQRLKLAFDEPP